MIVPKGSMWGMGLSVSRPARLAVSSPKEQGHRPVGDLVQDDRGDERQSSRTS